MTTQHNQEYIDELSTSTDDCIILVYKREDAQEIYDENKKNNPPHIITDTEWRQIMGDFEDTLGSSQEDFMDCVIDVTRPHR